MRSRLLWKLLAINVPVIAVVVVVMWLTIELLAADYFSALMQRYQIEPSETHRMFLDAVHRYLIQASLAALAVAVLLSFLFTRRVLRPLSEMANVAGRIATGDFGARVKVGSSDEVGQLGAAFNGMADSLERVETLRRRMVGDIAHELRTPLTTIRGYMEGTADGVLPSDSKTFAVLEAEMLRLVRLVENLHQLNKAEAARAFLRREPIVLAPLVQRALDMDRSEFEARDIQIEARLDSNAGTVSCDEDMLLQVVRNLVQNAWQHTPRGGTLRAEVSDVAEEVTVSFTSEGTEIDPADLPHIFERFYRTERSRSRESGGAGIGLAIVKEIVEAHGGRVGADSGDGETRIWFSLPTGASITPT